MTTTEKANTVIKSLINNIRLSVPESVQEKSEHLEETSAKLPIAPSVDLEDLENEVAPFEAGLHGFINDVQKGLADANYNPLAYDRNLERGIDYLGRALSVRDDGVEFTLRFMNALLGQIDDYNSLRYELNEIIDDGFVDKRLTADANYGSALEEAAKKVDGLEFEKGKLNAEAAHIAELTSTGQDRRAASATRLNERVAMYNARVLNSRVPGSALDYKARIGAMRTSFQENMLEAYWLLRSTNRGLGYVFPNLASTHANLPIYQKFPEFPQFTSSDDEFGFADKLLIWARHVSFVLDQSFGKSSEVRVFVPIADSGAPEGSYLKENVENFQDGSLIEVDVKASHFEGFANKLTVSARVLWINNPSTGGSASMDHYLDQCIVYSGTLKPPMTGSFQPQSVHLNDVACVTSPYEAIDLDMPIRNCDPVGNWKVHFKPDQPWATRNKTAEYVFLEFVVRGIPVLTA